MLKFAEISEEPYEMYSKPIHLGRERRKREEEKREEEEKKEVEEKKMEEKEVEEEKRKR